MRQVNRDELIFNLSFALKNFSATLLRDLAFKETARVRDARSIAAGKLVDALGRYQVPSANSIDHPAGDALFAPAANRGMPGVEQISGVPPATDG